MPIKYKDGDHISLHFDDHPGWEPVKGWHTEDHCQSELIKEYGDGCSRVTGVVHKYAFWGVGVDDAGERRQMFYDRDQPGKGRFKVTLAHTSIY